MELSCCPICESNRIKIVKEKISFQTPEGGIVIPNVTRQKCLACDEEFFDHQANLVLDRYRGKKETVAMAA